MKNVFIIAEAGDNHNGDISFAFRLVDEAIKAGADAVKFQTFLTENVISTFAEMAEYQKKNTQKVESQYEMVKKLELPFSDFVQLKLYCEQKGIKFLTTAFDLDSLAFVINDLKLNMLKIPSGEITNLPYLIKCAESHLPIILSTGMCNLTEIRDCLEILKSNGAGEITLLHCTTEYPAPIEQVNLLAMQTLAKEFDCEIGYSDHTMGILAPIIAVSLGATVIEKHFTLDKNMQGPDHKASLEPDELKQMVDSIRMTEKALGDGQKIACKAEERNKDIARKSIVAKTDIKKGEILTEKNITTKRPGSGISPMKWFEVLGKEAKKNFGKDELIEI